MNKGITDTNSSPELAVIQIFGPEHFTTQFGGGINNYGVTEAQLRLLVKRNRGQHILRGWREGVPGRELAKALAGLIDREVELPSG